MDSVTVYPPFLRCWMLDGLVSRANQALEQQFAWALWVDQVRVDQWGLIEIVAARQRSKIFYPLERLWLYCGGVSRVALTLAGIGRPAPNPGQSLFCSQSAIWQRVRKRQ